MLCNSPFCDADEGPRGVKRSHVPAGTVSAAAASPVPAPRYRGHLLLIFLEKVSCYLGTPGVSDPDPYPDPHGSALI
jgi:hypothetical protein